MKRFAVVVALILTGCGPGAQKQAPRADAKPVEAPLVEAKRPGDNQTEPCKPGTRLDRAKGEEWGCTFGLYRPPSIFDSIQAKIDAMEDRIKALEKRSAGPIIQNSAGGCGSNVVGKNSVTINCGDPK